MIYVLDQNYFRSPELALLIESDPTAQFVIPDVAFIEMCKSDKWQDVLRMSLSTLSKCPGRVYHSLNVGEALKKELSTRRSIDGHLLPIQFRAFTRTILNDVAKETSEAGISLLSKRMGEVQIEIRDNELNHSWNEESLKTRTKIMKDAIGADVLRLLRNGLENDSERLALIQRVAVDLLKTHLTNEGWSENAIRNFIKSKPLTLRFYVLSVRHAIEWAKKNGLDSMAAAKITNDMLDQEYILISSFFDGILSKEVEVNRAHEDLANILRMDA